MEQVDLSKWGVQPSPQIITVTVVMDAEYSDEAGIESPPVTNLLNAARLLAGRGWRVLVTREYPKAEIQF